MQIFEPEALTQVHGFDWFRGMEQGPKDSTKVRRHARQESYERLTALTKAQSLDNLVYVHKLDVTKDLDAFFDKNPHLQFKLVFLDAGTYEVVKASIRLFWRRLTKGGILILDQFNHELSPGETLAVKELLPEAELRTFTWASMPNAYVVK